MKEEIYNSKGNVRKIITMSSVDGPGNRYSIFLQGCNINCRYCHNPETIPFGQVDDDVKVMTVNELISDFNKYKDFVAGVSVSGGESTCQISFLKDLCRAFKDIGVDVLIDTNGTLKKDELENLAPSIQGFMLDIKAYDSKEHIHLTGVDNQVILENFKWMLALGKLVEVRTVIVPNLLSNAKTVDFVASELANVDASIRYKIIAYRPHGVRKELIKEKSPSKAVMNEMEEIAKQYGLSNIIVV